MPKRKPTVKAEEQPGLVYTPRKLSFLDLEAKYIVVDEIQDYFLGRFPHEEATGKYILSNRLDRLAFNSLAAKFYGTDYNGKGLAILFADATGELPVAEIVRWAEEYPAFFEECYQKAILLNPSLAPSTESFTAAQPTTKTAEGQPITPGEAEKNA